MTTYLALLRKDTDSDYGVEFPDFPGCVTAGRTLEEAQHMAVEALELHVAGMVEDSEAIPEPTPLDLIAAETDSRVAVILLVDVQTQPVRSVRLNITLPEDLVQSIDRSTPNRSRFLADAARDRLMNTEKEASSLPKFSTGQVILPKGASESLRSSTRNENQHTAKSRTKTKAV